MGKKKIRFRDIPQISRAEYAVDVSWEYIKRHLESLEGMFRIELDPPYQRGYVWTVKQQIAYLEYQLKGGRSGNDIFWNCSEWDTGNEGSIQIVDGKQRMNAVQQFMEGKVPAFGHFFGEFEDKPDPISPRFRFHVNDLPTQLEVVQWYLDMNTGGSVHTERDLLPAYAYLEKLEREEDG